MDDFNRLDSSHMRSKMDTATDSLVFYNVVGVGFMTRQVLLLPILLNVSTFKR